MQKELEARNKRKLELENSIRNMKKEIYQEKNLQQFM